MRDWPSERGQSQFQERPENGENGLAMVRDTCTGSFSLFHPSAPILDSSHTQRAQHAVSEDLTEFVITLRAILLADDH